jgi:hypothetical protein
MSMPAGLCRPPFRQGRADAALGISGVDKHAAVRLIGPAAMNQMLQRPVQPIP